MDILSPELAYCKDIEASCNSTPIAFLSHKLFESVTSSGEVKIWMIWDEDSGFSYVLSLLRSNL
jgi:hypothetical protein